jgi:hypothetical protein
MLPDVPVLPPLFDGGVLIMLLPEVEGLVVDCA